MTSRQRRTRRTRRTNGVVARQRTTMMTTTMGSAAATGGSGVIVIATIGPDRRGAGVMTRILTKTLTVGIIEIAEIVAIDGMTAVRVVGTQTGVTTGATITAVADRM